MGLRVSGQWNGWNGRDTVVQLSDGSVYQQDDMHMEFSARFNPAVTVGGTRLRPELYVEGSRKAVRVKKLR